MSQFVFLPDKQRHNFEIQKSQQQHKKVDQY